MLGRGRPLMACRMRKSLSPNWLLLDPLLPLTPRSSPTAPHTPSSVSPTFDDWPRSLLWEAPRPTFLLCLA